MSDTDKHNSSLDTLLGDVYNASEITPEQLLQYAESPESLTGEEKQAIATQLENSPALADELRILQSFNGENTETFATAVATSLENPVTDNNGILSKIYRLFATPWVPATAMAAIVLSVAINIINNKNLDTPQNTPQITKKIDEQEPIATNISENTETLIENSNPVEKKPKEIVKTKPKQILLAMHDPVYQSPYDIDSITTLRGNKAIQLLAPAIANTTSSYPKLYWLNKQLFKQGDLLFELINEESGAIILSTTLAKPEKTGLQSINLSNYDISLTNNTRYEWSILWQRDPDNPAMDQSASAIIKYQQTLTPLIYNAVTQDKIGLYAQDGYWYDALHESIKLKQRYPDNANAARPYNVLINTLP